MTIDEIWKYCLAMWKWIAKQSESERFKSGEINLADLKVEWLEKHGPGYYIIGDCFFCHWNNKKGSGGPCKCCPGKAVDKSFICNDLRWDYFSKPKEFYEKLLKMNKKRLAKK